MNYFLFFIFLRMKYLLLFIHQGGRSDKTKDKASDGTTSIHTSKGKECLAL